MSRFLQAQSAREATPIAFLSRQLFQSIPSIPDFVDLSGQTALITGSNSGLGFECARQLLALKLNHVVLAVRSQARGDAAAEALQAEFPFATIEVYIVDMASYDSIMNFASRCEMLQRFDIVILNAGLMQPSFECAAGTGNEHTFQINYLSTALIALVLMPILRKKSQAQTPARLSIIGSDTAYYAELRGVSPGSIFKAMNDAARFEPWAAYKDSKLLLLMFVHELSKRVSSDEVIINVPNPGACRGTQFGATNEGVIQNTLTYVASMVVGRSAAMGARQYTEAVSVKGIESHGSFISEGQIKPYVRELWKSCSLY